MGKIIVNMMLHFMDDYKADKDVKNTHSFVCDCKIKCRPCDKRA